MNKSFLIVGLLLAGIVAKAGPGQVGSVGILACSSDETQQWAHYIPSAFAAGAYNSMGLSEEFQHLAEKSEKNKSGLMQGSAMNGKKVTYGRIETMRDWKAAVNDSYFPKTIVMFHDLAGTGPLYILEIQREVIRSINSNYGIDLNSINDDARVDDVFADSCALQKNHSRN